MAKNSPERSCLGCRDVKAKQDLLRFVMAPDGCLVLDILSKLPGRGAYTCLKRSCLEAALKRNQFSRVFKTPVIVSDRHVFAENVVERLKDRVASYIALANKAGKVISGSDMVVEAVKRKNVGLVIIADDVSNEIGHKIEHIAVRESIPCYRALSRDMFGALLGKGLRSAVAVQNGDFVAVVIKEIDRFRNFSEEGAHE
ncbi:putative protein [Geobacter sp. OR-1]|uniref:DUF448 domain-containing protein n=1 Tax=Geobacter sp. OR-1 TaxID=1266765 RepID=UPI0005423B40|nr:DUF448 domain-containing protein [Geobacter sp. OR-1]GAM09975.1 putative protein [Geobacter sp. OR-1]